ncbi:MAG: hypothetical protein HXS41_08135 [Theionarchaea archaeon]|nr:hypothetical protein [Theionarchaea archaeon]MBU7000653.1 hypothetical protein [Theionarchaea archaeon]MBU7021015.1 hypothetical protein [Theionarchaea archaeon]MBU7040898.1 hypothetical protein [Theionarchaea archaeon]
MELKHTRVISFLVLALLTGLDTPLRPIFSLVLFSYFPGLLIVSLMKKRVDIPELVGLPLLVGISFWILFFYWTSGLPVLTWYVLGGVSFVCAVLADRQTLMVSYEHYWSVFILGFCCLFVVSYLYPWDQFFQWMPPGDDMKFHIPQIEYIISEHALPQDYGALYPEISTLTYSLGYHITAGLTVVAGYSIPSVIVATFFIVSLACFSFYYLGKTLFDWKTGIYAAFSFAFLSLFFHRLSSTGTYPNLLAVALHVAGLSLLVEIMVEKPGVSRLFEEVNKRCGILCVILLFSGAAETHPYILVLEGMVLGITLLYWSWKRDFRAGALSVVTGAGVLLLLVPFFLRFDPEPLSELEIATFTAWYRIDSFLSMQDLIRNIGIISPLLLFLGVFGCMMVERRWILGIWSISMMIIPLLSVFQIRYPEWYTISPNRFFFFLFMPLSIMSGRFLSSMEEYMTFRRFAGFLLILIVVSTGMHHHNLFHSFSQDPVSQVQMNTDDAFVIDWIAAYTPHDAVILNTGPVADCSSWVPALARRKVIFPFFSGHRGDNCIKTLKPYSKLADLKVLTHTPDSDLALTVLEKYGIRYIYIPAWRQIPWLDLHPELLVGSPLYRTLTKKGDAYLFEVQGDTHPKTTYFTVMEAKQISSCSGMVSLFFDPVVSFGVRGILYVQIDYADTTHEQIDIYANEKYQETIYTYLTGEERSLLLPLSPLEPSTILFRGTNDFVLEGISLLVGVEDCIRLSETVGLQGEWARTESGVIAPAGEKNLQVLVVTVSGGEVTLVYRDVGMGDVTIFGIDVHGERHFLQTISREGTGNDGTVTISLQGEYSVLALGVDVHGDDFLIVGITYTT